MRFSGIIFYPRGSQSLILYIACCRITPHNSGPEKGLITKGVFSLEESLESLKSLNSLESLENGRILLCFPQCDGSLKSLESLNSLESLENGLF